MFNFLKKFFENRRKEQNIKIHFNVVQINHKIKELQYQKKRLIDNYMRFESPLIYQGYKLRSNYKELIKKIQDLEIQKDNLEKKLRR